MNANTSPIGMPSAVRSPTASGNVARGDMTICARRPPQLAGERRKILGMREARRDPDLDLTGDSSLLKDPGVKGEFERWSAAFSLVSACGGCLRKPRVKGDAADFKRFADSGV